VSRPSIIPADISAYIAAHAQGPDEVLTALQARTSELGRVAAMQVSAEEGALLTLLTRLIGAQRAIEVGTFTGYSSICIARGMAPGGRLLCLDVSDEYTAIAREAWARAEVADRIELRLGPALDTLRALPSSDEPFDLAFVDAEKSEYGQYFDELLPRLRAGGVMLVDNTLWSGGVVDVEPGDERATLMQAFNDKVANDDRVESYILPISDGLTLVRKR
jgi:caffeoyl-CoA O-methyltransferase